MKIRDPCWTVFHNYPAYGQQEYLGNGTYEADREHCHIKQLEEQSRYEQINKYRLKGVHNLRHTFSHRLRAAGVSLETRKTLLGHANGDITPHYSAAELQALINAVDKITDRKIAQMPTMSLVTHNRQIADVGKVSEIKKGLVVTNLQTL